MDGFLTSPFISKFPENLKRTVFSGNSSYFDLFTAIKSGKLVAGMNGETFVDLLYELKRTEPELFSLFHSLEAAGKLQAKVSTRPTTSFARWMKVVACLSKNDDN